MLAKQLKTDLKLILRNCYKQLEKVKFQQIGRFLIY